MINQAISLFEKLFSVTGTTTIVALLCIICLVLIFKGGK